ncbi:DUF5914 domain-containing protein [Naumannella halotolerans]|uniref:Rieske-like 2Fe-2S protein n=1 Tax=Naumannella halotolerans TaxID=993414 RepID=A0A4V3ENN6_9ACTN|nr:DUF5914 domain-containing protein [Naumannella halotolerans]TDT34418.1 Rieske-like 2Fe-2S protein [Naumannella halotolerans]
MSEHGRLARLQQEVHRRTPIRYLPEDSLDRIRPTWQQARIGRIERALRRAKQGDPGGWHVVGSSASLPTAESITRTVAGQELVLWRADGRVHAGPGSCPHMGALLDRCPVFDGVLHCRWHGMQLPPEGIGAWRTLPAVDDGVLLWVRLPTPGEELSAEPTITPRPPLDRAISAVAARALVCEPDDVVANRLDPWHGAWFHPYAFSDLTVDESASDDEVLTVDVTFRLSRTWGVPVTAEFRCPDARTIVMTIVRGEGAGSVVETHATFLGLDSQGLPRTMMTEATIAHSDRPGFSLGRAMSGVIKPLMRRTALQLWVDDGEYAERRYEIRHRQQVRQESGSR